MTEQLWEKISRLNKETGRKIPYKPRKFRFHRLKITIRDKRMINQVFDDIEKLEGSDNTIHANPKRFAWLGTSERRHLDFESGFIFALSEINNKIKKKWLE